MQQLQVMNFLNEVASKFPTAISLASGRPQAKFFDSSQWGDYQDAFTRYYAAQKNCDLDTASALLCQYGPSAGVINDILSAHLREDEGIETDGGQIIVTNGCQEALALLCLHELKDPNDCMLTLDPSYIGFSGLLEAIGKKVEAIDVRQLRNDEGRFDWHYLKVQVDAISAKGFRPKALYVNPDFNNPLAYRLTQAERLSLLTLCIELDIKIIEDNPYSRFDYTQQAESSMMALDEQGIVYHIGSFSKTFCPGVRMGYLVVPANQTEDLDNLVALKSLLSVNTAQLAQSVIGGYLLENNYSLKPRMAEVNVQYQTQRDAVMASLSRELKAVEGIEWDMPEGGFFAVVSLPFEINEQDVYDCAEAFEVIFMPVGFFSLYPESWQGKVRLAFSNFDPEVLEQGVARFAAYVKQRMQNT